MLDERHVRAEDLKLRELTLAVVQLEQSRSVADLARVARRLAERLLGESELRRTFAAWLRVLERRLDGGDRMPPPADDLSLEDMTVSLEERVAEWPKPYIRQGISLGREQGIEQGIEHERELLRRQASARFGSATADRLAAAIGAEADPQRLMEVALAIVRCGTGSELLREIGAST